MERQHVYALYRWYCYEALYYLRRGMVGMAAWKLINAQLYEEML